MWYLVIPLIFFAVLILFFCLKQVIFPKEKRPPSKDLTDGLKKLKESCKIKKMTAIFDCGKGRS